MRTGPTGSGVRAGALRPLHYLCLSGQEVERGEFKRTTGLADRTAVQLRAALTRRGLPRSDAPQGALQMVLRWLASALTDAAHRMRKLRRCSQMRSLLKALDARRPEGETSPLRKAA